ncbi:xanthine dehydrogenase accessory protein XdhC [Thalassospira profundimaris]|uniref:xanthine dehydrogenase accessory protein XdhC n=1 Tax=Thalassospira profundimaris TaxID=502049 RepID=UPI000DED9AB0|nr:xanthine dehydrogenase accessory protein XdhC [Thalassospira profundimaris]
MSVLSPLSLDAQSWSALLAVGQQDQPVVMVTVAAIAGSTPREAGAFMLVGRHETAGTVGGGNLEHQLVRHVRKMLAEGRAPDAHFMRYPLGPALGQCCGGAVEVAFHALDARRKDVLRGALQAAQSAGRDPVWLMLPFEDAPDAAFALLSGPSARDLASKAGPVSLPLAAPVRGGLVELAAWGLADAGLSGPSGRGLLVRLDDAATPLWLFGAGHVGAAIVRALEPLPFDVTWLDSRSDYIDIPAKPRLHPIQSANPWEEIADMPQGAMALILTHSHAEDFEICRHALMRPDLAFVGMIGSETKRARFMARMRERGVSDAALSRLCCPIGVPGITGKHPAVIAASVVAQLVGLREQGQAQVAVSPARAGRDIG